MQNRHSRPEGASDVHSLPLDLRPWFLAQRLDGDQVDGPANRSSRWNITPK